MLLPLILLAVAGLVVYEKLRAPTPVPGRCSPAITMIPGHLYKFGYAVPAGTLLTQQTATQMAQTMVSSGNFGTDTQAWVRGDVSAVSFGWPPDAPDSAVLLYGTYMGPGEVVPDSFLGAMDCGPSSSPPVDATAAGAHAGHWGGVWGEDMMLGTASAGQTRQTWPAPVAADAAAPSSDCNCITPDKVMQLCVLILAQAMDQAQAQSAQQPQLQSMAPPPPAPMPAPAAPAPALTGALPRGQRAARMRKGQGYFVSYPAGVKLSSILWTAATVADAPMSPTQMVADPTQNVSLPTQSMPRSAPRAWTAHFGPGRAIAVLTWIGPDNGSDPGVMVWGTYSVGQAAAA